MNSTIKQAKLNEWANRIRSQVESGLSVRDWCAANQITKDQFYYWRQKCRDSIIQSNVPDIIPVSLPVADDCPTYTTSHPTTLSYTTTPDSARDNESNTSSFKLTTSELSLEINTSLPLDAIISIIKEVRNA